MIGVIIMKAKYIKRNKDKALFKNKINNGKAKGLKIGQILELGYHHYKIYLGDRRFSKSFSMLQYAQEFSDKIKMLEIERIAFLRRKI